MKEILKSKEKLNQICIQYDFVTYLGLFGSYARGEQTETSDIDLLFNYSQKMDYFDMVHLKKEFEKVLGKNVDLVPVRTLKDRLKPYVYKDLVDLYEKR